MSATWNFDNDNDMQELPKEGHAWTIKISYRALTRISAAGHIIIHSLHHFLSAWIHISEEHVAHAVR